MSPSNRREFLKVASSAVALAALAMPGVGAAGFGLPGFAQGAAVASKVTAKPAPSAPRKAA